MDRLAMLRRVNFHLDGVGGEAGVAKNPDADGNAGGVDRGAGEDVRTYFQAEEEDLHGGSAVDVHLAVFFSDSGDFKVSRWEEGGDGGASAEDVTKEPELVGVRAGGDGVEVPDYGALGVEVGGGEDESAAFGVLGCDKVGHFAVDEALDEFDQGAVVGDGVCPEELEKGPDDEDVFGGDGGVGVFKALVGGLADESHGWGEYAGADAGDYLELGARAAFGPAVG